MIAVRDVHTSAEWYCGVLGCQRDRVSGEFDRLRDGDRVLLLLHDRQGEEHSTWKPTAPDAPGDGFVLWLVTKDFDATYRRAIEVGARILAEPHENAEDNLREFSLRDLDGYAVAIIEE
jgi:catechol 2,3-dioxygenase-like lactoylglutathione lyase family enzyme